MLTGAFPHFLVPAEACDSLVDILGMQPLGGSESPSSASVHTLMLSGRVALPKQAAKVLARCRMTFEAGSGVTMELSVRGDDEAAVNLVLNGIA